MRFLYALLTLHTCLTAHAIDTVPTPVSPQGVRAVVDLPTGRHVRNIGGSDGAGLCVFTSIQMASDWHQVPALNGFQKWMSSRPGGGYPEKVDNEITAYCASQKTAVPAYVQHVGGDETLLDLCMKTGRMVGITYAGADGFYDGPILHMVNLVYLDANVGAIVDNNRPGKWVWMTRKQLLNRWLGVYDNGKLMTVREGAQTYQVGGGWAFILLAPPPPPYAVAQGVPPAVSVQDLPEAKNFGVQPPAPKAEAPPPGNNFGVDVVKLRAANRKYSLNGTEVSKAAAFAAVFSDDSDRFNLTFVGMEVPSSLPTVVRDAAHVKMYAADDWEVKQFVLKPGVTLRKPAVGRVGSEVYYAATYETNDVLAAINPGPVKPPVTPVTPGAVVLTEADLTAAGRAKLDAAGIAGITLSVTPKATPPPVTPADAPAAPLPAGVPPPVAFQTVAPAGVLPTANVRWVTVRRFGCAGGKCR